jgi:cytochrome c oxidase subunit 2
MRTLWTLAVLTSLAGALTVASARAQDASSADQLGRGKELFHLCQQCHGSTGGGDPLALAPSIAGLDAWYVEAQLNKFRDGSRASHFDDIAGMRMRGMARWLKTDTDVKAAAAYVASLPKVVPTPTVTGGDATRGAALYATCGACHGLNGEGVQAIGGPALNHSSDWYLVTQIKNYQQGIRGSDPRDVQGTAMRPMALTLPDEQAIKDVLAHIATLAPKPGGGAQ